MRQRASGIGNIGCMGLAGRKNKILGTNCAVSFVACGAITSAASRFLTHGHVKGWPTAAEVERQPAVEEMQPHAKAWRPRAMVTSWLGASWVL